MTLKKQCCDHPWRCWGRDCSLQRGVDCKAGDAAEVVFVSGKSYITLFPPLSSPTGTTITLSFIGLDQLKMYFLLTFYSPEKDSPVFHQPEILTFGRAVAHNQDGVIYEVWVAVCNVIQTWKTRSWLKQLWVLFNFTHTASPLTDTQSLTPWARDPGKTVFLSGINLEEDQADERGRSREDLEDIDLRRRGSATMELIMPNDK